MVLHPQAEAAMALWAQGPRVGDPGFDVDVLGPCHVLPGLGGGLLAGEAALSVDVEAGVADPRALGPQRHRGLGLRVQHHQRSSSRSSSSW